VTTWHSAVYPRFAYGLSSSIGHLIFELPEGTLSFKPDEFEVRYRIGIKLFGGLPSWLGGTSQQCKLT